MTDKKGLRKRQVLNEEDDSNNTNLERSVAIDEKKNKEERPKVEPARQGRSPKATNIAQGITFALHVAAIIVVVYGCYLRTGFHNGDECEMTYSRRNYVPISTADFVGSSLSYKLYKFVDARDPRHETILKNIDRPIADSSHCTTNNPFIVLYIPGHWGDYTQCRSVGAHGIQLTQSGHDRKFTAAARRALYDGSWNGAANVEEQFVYDVYCVDFAEQGAALHGNFIQKQSQYVSEIVNKLSQECSVATVTLVGHSIGGLVAKAVPVYYPSVGDRIRNIVTLATPHMALPFAFDESIHKVYHDLKSLNGEGILIASISGGLKDELIPARLCETKTGVSRVAGTFYGMDHKAVVWCYQVLKKVRQVLFVLSQDTTVNRKSALEQIGVVNGSYSQFVVEQETRFKEEQGFLSFIALESAMLYNAELLLAAYSIQCGMYMIFPALPIWIPVLIVTGTAMVASNYGPSLPATLVVCLLSSSIIWGLRFGFSMLPSMIQARISPVRVSACTAAVTFVALYAMILIISVIVGHLIGRATSWQLRSTIVIALIAWIMIEAMWVHPSSNPRQVTFASLILVTIPFLTSGKVVLFCWNFLGDYGPLDLSFALKVGLPIAVRFVVGRSLHRLPKQEGTTNDQPLFLAAHALNIIFFAARMMQMGSGYVVGYYTAWVALIESIRIITS